MQINYFQSRLRVTIKQLSSQQLNVFRECFYIQKKTEKSFHIINPFQNVFVECFNCVEIVVLCMSTVLKFESLSPEKKK